MAAFNQIDDETLAYIKEMEERAYPEGIEAWGEQMKPFYSNENPSIYIEGISKNFTEKEQNEYCDLLKQHQIVLVTPKEGQKTKADFLQALTIFFNEHLTTIIISGISAAAVEIIKTVISKVTKKLKNAKLIHGNKIIPAPVKIQLQFENITFEALLPSKPNKKKISKYIDLMIKTITELAKIHTPSKNETYILTLKDDNMKTQTILEYAQKHTKKHTKKKSKKSK